ncbi:hypothetical protein [Nocardia donostiensis]|uniref:Uncharacterized protein n=1 Tax=Nocardia donostiensis TaxID=1538463 RepID=A0A1V2TLG6_9NOCA|nr:hypothetical protein [Nocardia donostiensis]ONM50328.1 hypothetical protein B0T46_03180 [Nocardia donostiensis]OQS15990.1 hypothetical protein B0T36_07275 [Nocardia donostiensis]OQS23724.1 hypothetical protein B0T44_01715 [Nocardia donostiensis]
MRFRAAMPNRHGRYPGVSGLVNGLAAAGRLAAPQERFRRIGNDWYQRNLIDPSTVDPRVYDQEAHPGAAAWFKSTAVEMIDRVAGYPEILDPHDVAWTRVVVVSPDTIIYDDPHQVIAVPPPAARRFRAPPLGVEN